MPTPARVPPQDNRILVKLRPSGGLAAAESRANLRPLFESPPETAGLGVDAGAQWYLAELPDGAATAWDLAHARVADQLGVAASDVLFAEPDLIQSFAPDDEGAAPGEAFAAGDKCAPLPQSSDGGKKVGPDVFGWHLQDGYTELGSARAEVQFADPRTRIAHVDTGYYTGHAVLPEKLLPGLGYSFVEERRGARDPNGWALLDNSGHGTGTLGILAGGKVPAGAAGALPANGGEYLGGAPQAEVVPLRIADSVVLFRSSALARAIEYAVLNRCDVLSLSMGGVPVRAWEEAIDRAYEAGLCMVAAAGNHMGRTPPTTLVYPARYERVLAVCGVMADGAPYDGLRGLTMQGCFGPASAMKTAMAAYTPNIPWPLFHCPQGIRLNGEGTSSATPQVAAAAALWMEKYKQELPRDWRRVEAVRNALFQSARLDDGKNEKYFGRGVLQARKALAVRPRFGLERSARSSSSWAVLRLLTGLGIVEAPPREEMFNLEVAQLWLRNPRLEAIDPGAGALTDAQMREVMEALIEDERASLALRRHLASRYPAAAGRPLPPGLGGARVAPPQPGVCDVQPPLAPPPFRRVRVYAVDPSFSTRLDTAATNEVTLRVRWEALEPGPVGEYLAVRDTDTSGRTYEPVDLDDPRLLARDGWAPSEGNPQFHQQMVYAVAMKTVEHFEQALGRPVLWRPWPDSEKPYDDRVFVRQLDVRPHALRQANAYYSPREVALLFGSFEAGAATPGDLMPGSQVYTCLSHDIVAHETTHAVLDGMHRRFNEPTNPDVLALHEGFADIVALMQHFTIPEVLEREIARTRGDLEAESMLGSLAVQLGQAGGRGALREAIGRMENGVWTRFRPDPADLRKRLTPHARGAVLVAAVFDAFLAIYRTRTADLLRIYTGGTGVLPGGAIHPDLVRRLAGEAATSAGHVLNICIRALDYLPPVDVTFFEYLRALITADYDLVPDDPHGYRVAFVEAFRRRGIYPLNADASAVDVPRTLSVDTLRWEGLSGARLSPEEWALVEAQYAEIASQLKEYAGACLYETERESLFTFTREARQTLRGTLKAAFAAVPAFARELGVDPGRGFEVHSLRSALRVAPDGRTVPQVVVALTQSTHVPADPATGTPEYVLRSGATLVIDLLAARVKYRIVKNVNSPGRARRTAAFVREAASDPLRRLFFGFDRPEPFAVLHSLADEGV